MNCEIISIGDELLLGDTLNTNATWLGQILTRHGVQVARVHTIGDEKAVLQQLIREAMHRSDLVITTGGLGPTHDDITKISVAELFEAQMIVHEPTLAYIKKIFEQRNLPFSTSNYHQAEVPGNCEVLFNKQGTAPGLWFNETNSRLAVLPGIPREMKSLVKNQLLPKIDDLTNGQRRTFSFYMKFAGVGESTLSDEVIGPLDDFLSLGIKVAYLPSPQENTLRINVQARAEKEAVEKVKDIKDFIYQRAGNFIIGEGDSCTLPEALGTLLRKEALTIAVAESCTGGLLADRITDIPGSSDYMLGGVIAYANTVKTNQLGVSMDDLKNYGAVSQPVALQMAKGIASVLETNIGVSTTGIAGPGGGSEDKPVGTVWIGFWSTNHHFALHTQLTKDRRMNKKRTVAIAMEMARRTILGIEPMPYDLKPHRA